MADMNIIFSDDRGEFLEHYGVKGMKWHQHLKRGLREDLESFKRVSDIDRRMSPGWRISGTTGRSTSSMGRDEKGLYSSRNGIRKSLDITNITATHVNKAVRVAKGQKAVNDMFDRIRMRKKLKGSKGGKF